MLQRFTDWHESIKGELTHVAGLLADPIPDDPNALLAVLGEIESYNARVGYWLVESENFLKKFKYAYLSEKGDQSEAERKVKLEFDVSDYEMVKDKMEVILESIKQRVILGMSTLAYHRAFNISQGSLHSDKPF